MNPTRPKSLPRRQNPFRLQPGDRFAVAASPQQPENPFALADGWPSHRHAKRAGRKSSSCKGPLGRSLRAAAWLVVGIVLVSLLAPPAMQEQFLAWAGLPGAEPAEALPPLPVKYTYMSSSYGPRWGRHHEGVDLAAVTGEPVFAASSGKVRQSGWEGGYGKSVIIDHDNGTQTRYAHCSELLVKPGQRVAKGEIIAKVGSTGHSTGPHLHFEVMVDGVRKDPTWYYALDRRPVYPEERKGGRLWLAVMGERVLLSVHGLLGGSGSGTGN